MGKMFNPNSHLHEGSHNISSGSNSTDTDDEYVDIEPHSASPVYSPRRLAEANFSPRGLHNMYAEDSFDESIVSPRSTPQIMHRVAVDTPPMADPVSSKNQPEDGIDSTGETPSFPSIEPTATTTVLETRASGTEPSLSRDVVEALSNASTIPTTPNRTGSMEWSPVRKSSILKNRTTGEELKADGSKSSLRRDSHVQFRKEVRKVDILTDGDHDSEVSESVIDINDSANQHVDLRSNSSLIVNAMLHALVNKFGSSHRDKEKPDHTPIERDSVEDMRGSNNVSHQVAHHAERETSSTPMEQKDGNVVEPERIVVSPRRELVSSSMPNMRPSERVPDDTDRSISIEVVVDDQESDREIDEPLTSPSGHGFIIKEETTLTEFILRILEEIEGSLKSVNTEIRHVLTQTIQKLDAKRATSKSEPNMRVTPDLHKLLRSASAQIIKGTKADDVQGVKQVVSSLLSLASVKSELSGYEADGEDGDETEKSSMFVQTSDDTSDEPNPRTRLGLLGDSDMLPGDETKTDTFNRVMQWRQALKDTSDNRGGSSTESDLSVSSPTELETLEKTAAGSPPKLLSNHLVMRVQEEEKKQDLDGLPVEMRIDAAKHCADETDSRTPDTRRRSSILKHGGGMDQLKKDSHVQFKDDVIKVDVFTDGSDEAEISTSIVDLNDESKHKKPLSCDEDILNQLAQYMSSCDEDEKSSAEENGSLVSVSMVADSLINAFVKQVQRKSSDDVRFNHNAQESTFQNQMETVHLNLPTESPQAPEIEEENEQEEKWKEPLSTSMQDMRPKVADFDLMEKSASVEVIMDDAKFGTYRESQSEAQRKPKEASGAEITNKIINRLQLEENRPTDAVIHPHVIPHVERHYTAEELYNRIKEFEQIPVLKTSSTSSSQISEKSTVSLSSTGSDNLQPSVRISGSITKSPSDSSAILLTLDPSDYSLLLGSSPSSDLSSRISVTPVVSDSITVPIFTSVEITVPTRHENLSDASATQIPTTTSQSKTSQSSSESSLDIISDILSNTVPLSKKEKPGSDDKGKQNRRSSEPEIAESEESLGNAFANWIVQQMPLKDLIKEYEEWKEMKKRGGDKKESESNKISTVAGRYSAPCVRSNERETVTAARNTYSTSGIGSKLALSELFGQLLLFDGIDTECGDVVEISSSSQISDTRLSDEYADDEGSDTTTEFPEKENIEYAIRVSEISAELPLEFDIPAKPHVPSPPMELNTSVILSSLKKSLEKLDLQLTAGVPFVDLTKLPFAENVKKQQMGERVEETPSIDSFPARDRLLKLIRRQPSDFNLEPVADSASEEQMAVGNFDGRPGQKLLELIKCMPEVSGHVGTVKPSAEDTDTERQKSKTLVDAEVQSDDTASQKSDETDLGHNKLLKLIVSLDKFGLFLPTALGHPSLTDLPPREETKTDLKKKADAENETCLAGDWVIVHIEDVPDVEMIMRKSAEDIIEKAIERLENVVFEEEIDTKPIWDKTVSEGTDKGMDRELEKNNQTDGLKGISSLPAYFSPEHPEEKSKQIQISDDKKVK